MKRIDDKLVKQLKDVVQEIVQKKKKRKKQKCSRTNAFYWNSVRIKNLLQWFDTKIKSQNLEINLKIKI